jgi:hypothetical protein
VIERYLEAELAGHATGKRYAIDIKKLDVREQQELLRLIRDLKDEVASVKRQARTQPWRFMR